VRQQKAVHSPLERRGGGWKVGPSPAGSHIGFLAGAAITGVVGKSRAAVGRPHSCGHRLAARRHPISSTAAISWEGAEAVLKEGRNGAGRQAGGGAIRRSPPLLPPSRAEQGATAAAAWPSHPPWSPEDREGLAAKALEPHAATWREFTGDFVEVGTSAATPATR